MPKKFVKVVLFVPETMIRTKIVGPFETLPTSAELIKEILAGGSHKIPTSLTAGDVDGDKAFIEHLSFNGKPEEIEVIIE